jgi:hypothetical protein
MDWRIKAFIQKGFSILPYGYRLNYLAQSKFMTGFSLSDQHFAWKIEHARDHLAHFDKYGQKNTSLSDAVILEIGTGWYPVIPLSFYLCGCNEMHSVDIYQWMNSKTFFTCIDKFKEWHGRGILTKYLFDIDEKRLYSLLEMQVNHEDSIENLCAQIGLTLHKGSDLLSFFSPQKKMDLIISNNTFEHIYLEPLRLLLDQLTKLMSRNGLMSHFIDMSDHFEHGDKKISIYNFLKFNKSQWKLIDNKIQPQNRLRFIDYLELHNQTGWEILFTETRPGDVNELREIKLSKEFRNYSAKDLAVSHGYIVSKLNV